MCVSQQPHFWCENWRAFFLVVTLDFLKLFSCSMFGSKFATFVWDDPAIVWPTTG